MAQYAPVSPDWLTIIDSNAIASEVTTLWQDRNVYTTIIIIIIITIIMPDILRVHYKMTTCVRLSVACLDLTLERKGLGSPQLETHHTGKPWTYLEVKSQRSRSPGRLTLPESMHHKQVGRDGRIAIFLKLFCYYFVIIIIIYYYYYY